MRCDLDREQHVQGPEQERLDSEEIERQDPLSLGPQELAPGGAATARSRAEAASPKERTDLRCRHPDAELGELAPDADAPHLAFSLPIRRMSSRTSSVIGGVPLDLRLRVHSLRTSSRCQRRSVCGFTTNDDHRARDSLLLIA